MTENETYVPLEKSALWNDMTRREEMYKKPFPTKLHVLDRLLLSDKTFWSWSVGGVMTPDEEGTYDRPHRSGSIDPGALPEDSHLFALVPELPQDRFLQEIVVLSRVLDGAYTNRGSTVSEILDNRSPACRMPLDIDVHYLAATMLMLKQAYLDSGRLFAEYIPRDKQHDAVRKALNTGFDIIRERGIEENFAKACAELSQKLPELTAFSEKYLQKVDEDYRDLLDLKGKLEALHAGSPASKSARSSPGKCL